MVKVPEDVRKTFEKNRIISMATADLTGKPNVILVGMWWWEDEETLVVVNNFLKKDAGQRGGEPSGRLRGSGQ